MREPSEHVAADGRVTWKVRFRLNGKQTSYTFATQREAQEFCRDLVDLGPAGAARRVRESERRTTALTMDALWSRFIAWKEPRVLSDRTIREYGATWRNWIQPTFGGIAADDVTAHDVQAWIDKLADGTLNRTGKRAAVKSIQDRHALLHSIFEYACAPSRGLIDRNPCTATDMPKKNPVPPKGLMPAEWAALRAAIRQINADAGDLADFLAATGWRYSEATGLSTYDVEDYGDSLYVSVRQVLRRNAANRWVIVEDVKASGSGRRIQLDRTTAALIRQRLSTATPGGLVFTNTGSQWHYPTLLDDIWNPAVKVANLNRRPTPHWLRHSAVLWGVMGGANLAELSSRIGHRHISTTIDVYGRAITDVQTDVLERIAALRDGQAPPALPRG